MPTKIVEAATLSREVVAADRCMMYDKKKSREIRANELHAMDGS